MLALDEIPHWDDGHVNDIRTLREYLQPNGYWEDVRLRNIVREPDG
jgi:hypothetical protein